MNVSLSRLSKALLAAFVLVALALGYWTVVRGDQLLARDDNPRRVLAEQRIQRGQILDRDGQLLAETRPDPESGLVQRHYPHPEVAPVVGYYSLRYGLGGIEAAYDDVLRSGSIPPSSGRTLLHYLMHKPLVGDDVQLTLSLSVQQTVEQALGDRTGAVVVITVPHGEVLALSSHPTFDPNTLDQNWDALTADPDAPLFNRATQGLYQPGTILQSIVLGAALDTGSVNLQQEHEGIVGVYVDNTLLPCADQRGPIDTLTAAYLHSCPAPFQAVAQQVGARRLDAVLADFGLLEPPPFTLPVESVARGVYPAQTDLLLTAVGQSNLTVTPLQMALVAAAFADRGQMPPLRLMQAVRPLGGSWEAVPAEGFPRGTISPASADLVAGLMRLAVAEGAAQAAALPGYAVHGHSGLAISGPEGTFDAWFIGYVHQGESQAGAIAVAVIVEDTGDVDVPALIGGQALQAALSALAGIR